MSSLKNKKGGTCETCGLPFFLLGDSVVCSCGVKPAVGVVTGTSPTPIGILYEQTVGTGMMSFPHFAALLHACKGWFKKTYINTLREAGHEHAALFLEYHDDE